MGRLRLKFDVITPIAEIDRRIKGCVADKMNDSTRDSLSGIRDRVEELLERHIRDSHEVKEILSGNLRHQLGATTDEARAVVEHLVDSLKRSIDIDFKRFRVSGGKIGGSLTVSCFPKTLIDEMSSFPQANFLTKKGVNIEWMKWLLTLGDRIIVKRYDVDYVRTRGSRSGGATMKPTKVRGWRVPPSFSGTRTDNFITRALDSLAGSIGFIIVSELYKNI